MQLLRAWERRYGVVEPARTESGYRLYDEASIARLRAMRHLVDQGWAPSTAAVHLRDLDEAAISDLLEHSGTAPAVVAPTAEAAPADALRAEFVEAASTYDEARVERVLDEMFMRGSYEQITSELILPALADLGDAWADGRVDVAGEHAASGAVERRLGMAFMAAGAPRRDDDLILVGMPPGGRHHLGALVFATTARRAGLAVRYLGADLPVEDWVDAVRRTNARAVVIGVVMRADARAAAEVARAIRAADPSVVVALGGPRSAAVPAEGLGDVMVLDADLEIAVGALREELRTAA